MQCARGSSSGQRQELNKAQQRAQLRAGGWPRGRAEGAPCTPAEGIAAFCNHNVLCLCTELP